MLGKALLGILLAVALVTGYMGIQIHQGNKYVGKCFQVTGQPIVFGIADHKFILNKFDNAYLVEGVLLFMPFKKVLTSAELSEILAVSDEISCKTGEPIGESTNQ